ncbi:cytochrome b [Undibacterium cyanobacteriorum]|uniref:Cytochrome b n=1 Tax=Undibacterium cyanobacteriorum TaxID=3073561 RepID=A0ABY9RFE9_9BURK|nr:cytochrome b [Undibacterium sp. 20NA77.5]WMW79956.1 cytochrome b [Undibacterium sp. 20NA77.5]
MQTLKRYPSLSIALHWLIALLIIMAFALGTYMTDMSISPTKLKYYAWHKWLGVTILVFVAIRLLTRLTLGTPDHLGSLKPWEKSLASATHVTLYVLMFAVPITGYLYSYAAGFPVVFLGLVQLPAVLGPFPELKDSFKDAHEILTSAMAILVLLHIGAALKHRFIDKDQTLQRMLPGRTEN